MDEWIESFCVRRNGSNINTIAVILVGHVNHKIEITKVSYHTRSLWCVLVPIEMF